ncbi:MAG: hypothetical protein LBP62_02955 [Clostridiales bacterium]|nr:hypothetical protein [Clostridiales bacterium]
MTVVTLFLPVLILLVFVIYNSVKKQNNNYDRDTFPLKFVKRVSRILYIPFRNFLSGFFSFLRDHTVYFKLWLFIWAINLNLMTVVLSILAFLFYFVVSFDFGIFYSQIYRFIVDLAIPLRIVPWYFWVGSAVFLFDYFRRKIAYSVLRRYELRDRGFINSLPIVNMIVGTMGKKKTTLMTDMALSQTYIFRDKAFSLLLENDLKFPYFPWIIFELDLRSAFAAHEVYNLATCRTFVSRRREIFERSGKSEDCFGYDFKRYGLYYNNGLEISGLWDVLETYALLYFIYVIESSLLVSNYSIREDVVISDVGNFPLWNDDFFRRDSRLMAAYSRHSHILDFDAIRLGRRVIEDNFNRDSFDFGALVITEAGKERGNQVENQGLKKTDLTANQKNDGFNFFLKMIRHSSTVDFFPFVKVLLDEQRPESLGADARELCNIVHIRGGSDQILALPLFFVEELLYDLIFSRFVNFYREMRYLRGDNSLLIYMLKSIAGKLNTYYKRIYNTFGFCRLALEVEQGTLDGNVEKHTYYLMNKKIYSRRFSTDCFSDYFFTKTFRSAVGIADVKEYETEKASFDELKGQNSYFVNELFKYLDNEKE